MSTSTSTSWSSARDTLEAETPRTEVDPSEDASGLKDRGKHDDGDASFSDEGSSNHAAPMQKIAPYVNQRQTPLDPIKLSRIAQAFGVVHKISGVGSTGSSERLIAGSGSTYATSEAGHRRTGSRHVSSTSVAHVGGIRSLAVVEARTAAAASASSARVRSASSKDVTHPGQLVSPAFSSFSRSTSSSALYNRSASPRSAIAFSQDLITVIPPDHLLLPSFPAVDASLTDSHSTAAMDAHQSQKELQRWRSGRVLPLRSTLREMVAAIIKEWGLPSAVGVDVYLVKVNNQRRGSATDSEADGVEDDLEQGSSLIGPEAWSILWSRVRTRPAFVPSTQWETERKLSAPSPLSRPFITCSNEDATGAPSAEVKSAEYVTPTSSTFGLGPSVLEYPSPSRSATSSPGNHVDKDEARRAQAAGLGQGFPSSRAPSPTHDSIIVGKIEFDIDRHKAVWYDLWNQRRKESAARGREEHGLRKLVLREKGEVKRSDGISLRPLAPTPSAEDDNSGSEYEAEDENQGYAQLDGQEEDEESSVDQLADIFPTDEDEFAALRRDRQAQSVGRKTFDFRDVGTDAVLSHDVDLETMGASEPDRPVDEVDEVAQMLMARETPSHLLLASPIHISSPDVSGKMEDAAEATMAQRNGAAVHGLGVGLLADERVGKRGSGLVMSDKLDHLEQVLRDLSPRDLHLDQPMPVSHALPASTLVTPPMTGDTSSVVPPAYHAEKRQSPSAKAMLDSVTGPMSTSSPPSSTLASWPAIPFVRTPEGTPVLASLASAERNAHKLTPRSAPEGSEPIPLSPETMMRMEYDHMPTQQRMTAGGGWRPQRPARPPSPSLASMIDLARTLPVDGNVQTERKRKTSMPTPPSEGGMGSINTRDTASSSSQVVVGKSLKHQMSVPKLSKLFHRDNSSVSVMDTHPTIDGAATSEGQQARGRRPSLWSQHRQGSSASGMSISAPLSPEQLTEFGTLMENKPLPFVPSDGTHGKALKSPIIGIGFGKRLFKGQFGGSSGHGKRVSGGKTGSGGVGVSVSGKIGSPTTESETMTMSPVHPSEVSMSPIQTDPTSSTIPQSPDPDSTDLDRRRSQTTSPKSPNSVRRKPVPRAEGSDGATSVMVSSKSMSSSMNSFVSEQAPRRRDMERE